MFFYRGSDFWRSPTVRHGQGRANRGGEQQMCAANGHCRPQRRSFRPCTTGGQHHRPHATLPTFSPLSHPRTSFPPLRPSTPPHESYFTFSGYPTASNYTFPDTVLCKRCFSITPIAGCGHQRRAVVIPPSRPRGALRW